MPAPLLVHRVVAHLFARLAAEYMSVILATELGNRPACHRQQPLRRQLQEVGRTNETENTHSCKRTPIASLTTKHYTLAKRVDTTLSDTYRALYECAPSKKR